jgi:acetylornithine deacetylase/succinyl-diaminopimelate desuccinylase-like protein
VLEFGVEMRRVCAVACMFAALGMAEDNRSLPDRARQYTLDLIRLDTSNPPGNETRVAEYLKEVADAQGIPCELVGADPRRMNFVARLRGAGKNRPLLLMAHSDVVPADRTQWTTDPFAAELRNGWIYGRGAWDDKSLLATELAVMVEIKRRNIKLNRDLILLVEADQEEGATGIQWIIQHAWPKIDAEFALNDGGVILETKEGTKIFEVQTAEKVPLRVVLTARGTAGQSSQPRDDNPIVRLSRAVVKLTEAEQPARVTPPVRRYLREISKLPEYAWLAPLLPRMENPATIQAAAREIRAHDAELDAILHTTISPIRVRAGARNNVIPNSAEAQVDVRRLLPETREEVLERIREIIGDNGIEVAPAPGSQTPANEASPIATALYKAIERAVARAYPHDPVVPSMSRSATDAAFLRARGVPVYGVPIFSREAGESRAHGNDERISPKNLEEGAGLLWQMVLEIAGGGI